MIGKIKDFLHIGNTLWKNIIFYIVLLALIYIVIAYLWDFCNNHATKTGKRPFTIIKPMLISALPLAYYVGNSLDKYLYIPNLLTPEIMNYGTLCICGIVLVWNLIQFGPIKSVPFTLLHVIVGAIGGYLCSQLAGWMLGAVGILIAVMIFGGGGTVSSNDGTSGSESARRSSASEQFHLYEHPSSVCAVDNAEVFRVSKGSYGSLQIYRFDKWNTIYKNSDGTYSDGNGYVYKRCDWL